MERMTPLITTQTKATMVTTPKTYTHEPTEAGWRSGSRWSSGRPVSNRRRTARVQLCWGLSALVGSAISCTPIGIAGAGEWSEKGQYEQHDHRADDDQVGNGDEDETPVEVLSRCVH